MAARRIKIRRRTGTDSRTVRMALDLLERTAGRRRRCRRCGNVIPENARKLGAAWSVCAPCATAIEADARQIQIGPPLVRECLVCLTSIEHRQTNARTCGGPCKTLLARILAGTARPDGSQTDA